MSRTKEELRHIMKKKTSDDLFTMTKESDLKLVSTVVHYLSGSLSNAMEAKDRHVRLHSEEVAEVSQFLAVKMGLDAEMSENIHIAGHLHDIGKIGIPDQVLQKAGKLNSGEWALIREHPRMGADILEPLAPMIQPTGIIDMILSHHERFDGRGYPHGLAKEDIPLGARVIAVADTLSAMLQDRPYRKCMSFDRAANEIQRCSGTQFDPDVAGAFMDERDAIQDLFNNIKAYEKKSINSQAFRLVEELKNGCQIQH